ncbi:MAG: hypothetical protein CME26_16930 [Gemmatimonadetes bacterium]|nr:hypothetical protein [Gemmatimonadota bacterium]|tara:strand:+ start:4170 stop:4562 length:393 start_codon:yes stop_codon:yes gene_type:complete
MKILIVDDDPEVAEFLSRIAQDAGWEVDTVVSGEDAVGRSILVDYDLISLDVGMSGVSGLDAISVIRGLSAHTIIAIVSAFTESIDDDDLDAADVVIPKPVDVGTFRSLLTLTGEIVERQSSIRQLGLQS